MSHPISDRVLALAGVVQAAELVNVTASGGKPEELYVNTTLRSIVKTESRDVPSVFGGVQGLGCGLQRLATLLSEASQPGDATILRYTLTLMQLQGKVLRRRALREVLDEGIARARNQLQHFEPVHANVLANFADTYLHSAGAVQPRIMVTGDATQLQNQRVVNLVRSLLLGGLRAAVLWRQCSGSRWMLLFMRSRLQREAKRLLAEGNRLA